MRTPAAVVRRLGPAERFPIRLSGAAVGLVLVAIPASLVVLAVTTRWTPVVRWDISVTEAVHRAALASNALRGSATAITHFGDTGTRAAITVLAVLVLAQRRAFRSAAFLAIVVPLGILILTLIKLAVDRARPVLPEPFEHANGTSFPSGHAMGSLVCYGALLLVVLPFLPAGVRGAARWLTGAVVAAVGLSRVVLGVHYPSDVLGGWLIGLGWLFLAAVVFDRWRVAASEPSIEDPTESGIEPDDARRG